MHIQMTNVLRHWKILTGDSQKMPIINGIVPKGRCPLFSSGPLAVDSKIGLSLWAPSLIFGYELKHNFVHVVTCQRSWERRGNASFGKVAVIIYPWIFQQFFHCLPGKKEKKVGCEATTHFSLLHNNPPSPGKIRIQIWIELVTEKIRLPFWKAF